MVDIYEHRRLEEPSGARDLLTPSEHARALLDRVGDVILDRVELRQERDRPHLHGAVALRLAHAQRAHFVGDFGHERVVHGLLDVRALDRDARLAGVLHRVVGREVGRALEVRVG